MHYVSYLWRDLGPPLLWLWPLITIDKELRDAVVKFATRMPKSAELDQTARIGGRQLSVS